MNTITKTFKTMGLCLVAIVLVSCSKDENNCDPEDKESPCYAGVTTSQYFKMEIAGAEWKATNTPGHLFFIESPVMEIDEHTGVPFYYVELVGLTGSDPNGITIQLHLPADKFSNPKGTYPIIADVRKLNTAGVSSAWVYAVNGTPDQYVSVFPESMDDDTPLLPDAGMVTITDFEVGNDNDDGNQKRLYRIKGTFSAPTIYGLDVPNGFNGNTESISSGEFNLINALYQQ
ncbi:hypothetical protein [Parapedobacter lycopersici]|uniref:hypothetical protein n=1 Tax=Parapedobacter lycopersici TaxID=1864939 RepID=UPI00214DAEEA|nr:hypothetical protein [Parapedobacter lycopersici]